MAEKACEDFKNDVQVEIALEAVQQHSPELVALLGRSCIKPVAVQQFRCAFDELGYRPDPATVTLTSERSGGIITTLPVEDIHNVQKKTVGR